MNMGSSTCLPLSRLFMSCIYVMRSMSGASYLCRWLQVILKSRLRGSTSGLQYVEVDWLHALSSSHIT